MAGTLAPPVALAVVVAAHFTCRTLAETRQQSRNALTETRFLSFPFFLLSLAVQYHSSTCDPHPICISTTMVRIVDLAATVALWAGVGHAQSTGYKTCDALIDAGLGDSLLFATGRPGDDYSASLNSYYSLTIREITPWCILQPKNTEEVSKAITALNSLSGAGKWNVAIRGAGHSTWNNNNIAQGLTIDLGRMNSTKVHNTTCASGKAIASIGPGARWGPAVLETEKYGLAVTGGRVGGVGVSGLTLGGGLSFYSGRHGFACDSVVNFEVVLADGSIVNANKRENARLFKALKGGSNNFGIVTRFDMAAFPAGKLYGGTFFTTWDQRDRIIDGLIQVISVAKENPADSQIALFQYQSGGPGPMVGTVVVNTDGNETSPAMQPLEQVPAIIDMRAKQTYGELVTAMNDVGGKRNIWFSLCFHNDKRVVKKAEELFLTFIDDMNAVAADQDFQLIFVFQPLPKHYASFNPGGNVLGMDKTLTEDSIVWLGEAFIGTPALEALVQNKLGVISASLEAYAESIDANTQWRYINYVNPTQDPLKSYGEENVAFLREVAQEYDPTGFFQTRVSGGFKISVVE
ncbi:FAD-dependent monooxygenase CTB5 [Paramyrothecium foliicola]|nr:FAD-dependent monooxygenase CTB5 [Paramyrothecium foliicola]